MKLSSLLLLIVAGCLGGGAKYRAAPEGVPSASRAGAGEAPALAAAGVAAGEWDDNANYREFQRFLAGRDDVRFHALDIRDRQFLVVHDIDGKPVPGCRITAVDGNGRVAQLITQSSGRAILFPHAEGLVGSELKVMASCAGGQTTRRITLVAGEGVHTLPLSTARALAGRPVFDIAFILDTTGSMGEEIEAVKDTIRQVASGIDGLGVNVRIAMIEYKDRGDSYVTRVHPFTSDLRGFAGAVAAIEADGGGDLPESVNAGLHDGVSKLAWSPASAARLAFLIGDAPPHLDYPQDVSYATSAKLAARRGIQLYTVAASGMDLLGQVVFRQVAQYTGATNLFVLRGGAGPQSTGAGDPASSCGGNQTEFTSGNLDQLLIARIRGAVAALDADPLRIPGLGQDENAKPCAARVVLAR